MFSFLKGMSDGGSGSKRMLWLILIGGGLGILLILFGSGMHTVKAEENASSYRPEEDELIRYQSYLESRIRTLCESVEGVGEVTVALTLAGGFSSVYATEYPNGYEEYVILGNGSSAEALYLTREAPQIAGIGIVCRGGRDAQVRAELIALLCATFHISSHRVYVTAGG